MTDPTDADGSGADDDPADCGTADEGVEQARQAAEAIEKIGVDRLTDVLVEAYAEVGVGESDAEGPDAEDAAGESADDPRGE